MAKLKIEEEDLTDNNGGESLDKKTAVKWYFRTSWMVVAFLSFGPLALPLVWFNPRLTPAKKIVISIVVLFLSYWAIKATGAYIKLMSRLYRQMLQGIY